MAVDIGASSGRHILGHVADGKIVLEEMYRFENRQIRSGGHDCWNVKELYQNILSGMKACREAGKIPSFMAVDTWGVDFVLLDREDQPIGPVVSYRDQRTEGMDQWVEQRVPGGELYETTGIQKQIFNTLYQLSALQKEAPEQLQKAESLLMIPDFFHFLLTGVKRQEYTNATTTGLVNAAEKQWDYEVIRKLGFPEKLFGRLSMPGSLVGSLLPEVKKEIGYDCAVILPATHDTGSAFLAVPARDEYTVYLSSGTWSLLGVENAFPITTEKSRRANFTNEGGYQGRFRYLKNIMGLWILQSIRRECNGVSYVAGKEKEKVKNQDGCSREDSSRESSRRQLGFADLISLARECREFPSVIDVDDPCFLAPESMTDAVKAYCIRTGQQAPQTLGETLQCVYHSLALRYGQNIKQLEGLTGKTYTSINIVGGGCQDRYLNEMTAKEAGLSVYAGPVEGTALGNLIVQMLYNKEFADLGQARKAITDSFEIQEVKP